MQTASNRIDIHFSTPFLRSKFTYTDQWHYGAHDEIGATANRSHERMRLNLVHPFLLTDLSCREIANDVLTILGDFSSETGPLEGAERRLFGVLFLRTLFRRLSQPSLTTTTTSTLYGSSSHRPVHSLCALAHHGFRAHVLERSGAPEMVRGGRAWRSRQVRKSFVERQYCHG